MRFLSFLHSPIEVRGACVVIIKISVSYRIFLVLKLFPSFATILPQKSVLGNVKSVILVVIVEMGKLFVAASL